MKLVFMGIGVVLIVIATILWTAVTFVKFEGKERIVPIAALVGMIGLSVYAIIEFISRA